MFAPPLQAIPGINHRMPFHPPAIRQEKAFTLVEVALALGIISFSLLSILGMMPVGFDALRKAMDQTVETQIVQKVSGAALLTPYTDLATSFAGQTSYYDDAGGFLANSPTAPPDKTRYWVTVQLADPVYPGSSNAVSVGSSLKAVKIQIVNAPSASAANKKVSNYVIQVPNCGN